MKSIFSAFRSQQLSKGKFGSYGLYALGEIVLIVLGILVALGIDNWNNERKDRIREQYYLTGLKEEFRQNKIKLNNLIEVNRTNYESARDLANYLRLPSDSWSESLLSKHLFQAFAFEINYNPAESILNEIISSGGLNQITNPILRKGLTGWEPFIQQVHLQEIALRAERQKVIDLFRQDQGSIRTILEDNDLAGRELELSLISDKDSNRDVVRSRSFENRLLMYMLTSQRTESALYLPLLETIDALLSRIDEEID